MKQIQWGPGLRAAIAVAMALVGAAQLHAASPAPVAAENHGLPPINHVEAIIVGAPSFGGQPVGANRFYGADDPRRSTGRALGY